MTTSTARTTGLTFPTQPNPVVQAPKLVEFSGILEARHKRAYLDHYGDGESCPCPITDRINGRHTGSAELVDEDGKTKLRCCLGRTFSLATVRAVEAYRKVPGNLPRREAVIWMHLLLHELEAVEPAEVDLPELGTEASELAHKLRDGLALFFGLSKAGLVAEPFSARFAAAWCGLPAYKGTPAFKVAAGLLLDLRADKVIHVAYTRPTPFKKRDGSPSPSYFYLPGPKPPEPWERQGATPAQLAYLGLAPDTALLRSTAEAECRARWSNADPPLEEGPGYPDPEEPGSTQPTSKDDPMLKKRPPEETHDQRRQRIQTARRFCTCEKPFRSDGACVYCGKPILPRGRR